jgi:hypothetical protein
LMALAQQKVGQVRPDETCPTSHKNAHEAIIGPIIFAKGTGPTCFAN